ncbi:Cytochrome P450, E-class, group I [Heracleum sosnowskyi]|uniref:Cytochrome P450, E-class, group I n=1 Tax=Heracleum sosnowskyi TaxID=360622 RepID=A0AAD8I7P1_9APIA|nr:Cytochrome P450, E-class, group I [Heracleum sosnowskyi]
MEWENYVFWSALISFILLVWHLRRKNSYKRSKLPPGPKGWPVFGNLFDLGSLPHRRLEALRQQFGPVVWLKLGFVNTMVLLSAGAAEEFFKNHDLSFLDRFTNDSMRSHDYDKISIAFGSCSTYWRTLRRICTSELFANKRINDTMLIRQKSVDELLSWIDNEVEKGASGGLVLRNFVFPALFNMIGNLTLSQDLVNPQSKISSEFFTAMDGVHECVGRPNISDLLPWLRKLDLQGIRRKMDCSLGKAIEIILIFVKERLEQRKQKQKVSEQKMDFLDVLLDYRGNGKDEPVKLSEYQVTIFLMEMFFAGTDSTRRRMCPGLPLAHRIVPLVLGSLLHHFEWELCDGVKNIDMRETMGAGVKLLDPLQAIPKQKMM